MAIHDAYTRRTPFEVAFPRASEIDRWVSELLDSISGEDATALEDPGRFLSSARVARRLAGLRDPEARAEEVHEHGIHLYHAFRFSAEGRPLYALSAPAARYLVETGGWAPEGASADGEADPDSPPHATPVAPPARAGYLQLPRNLFWYRPPEATELGVDEADLEPPAEATPEPVDGMYWAVSGSTAVEGRVPALLNVLAVAGVWEGRPGFSVVPLPSVPLAEAGRWLDADVREGGRDFESTLPGGELERLYSFERAGEVLKLLARFFRYVALFPGAVVSSAGAEDAPDRAAPAATSLPSLRVTLQGEELQGEETEKGEAEGG